MAGKGTTLAPKVGGDQSEQQATTQEITSDESMSVVSDEQKLGSNVQGNSPGADAVRQAADYLDELLSDESTGLLELTSGEIALFEELAQAGRQYADANKVHQVGDIAALPADVQSHFEADSLAMYYPEHDLIYLLAGPLDPRALNDIVHELSHAINKESPDSVRLRSLHDQLTVGGGDTYENTAEMLLGLDYYLTETRVEIQGEISGNMAEEVAENASEQGGRSGGRATKIDRWRSGKTKGRSSSSAHAEWKKISRRLSAKNLLQQPHYKDAGEAYIEGNGPFPSGDDFATEP